LRVLAERLRKKRLKTTKTLALKHRLVPSTASSSATDLSIVSLVDESNKKDNPEPAPLKEPNNDTR
jgi:hypothetical protein